MEVFIVAQSRLDGNIESIPALLSLSRCRMYAERPILRIFRFKMIGVASHEG